MPENILDENLEKPRSAVLVLIKVLFSFLVIAALGSFLFFNSQLTDNLDALGAKFNFPNVSNELAVNNEQILDNQTEINYKRYLKIKGHFDNFSYYGDFYIQNYKVSKSQTASATDRLEAENILEELREKLRTSFLALNEEYKNPFTAPLISKEYEDKYLLKTVFQESLITLLNEKASAIKNEVDPQARRYYKNYIDIKTLVGNEKLKNLILDPETDFDSIKDEELFDFIQTLNSLIVNDLSTMKGIKKQRIKWSDIIDEIELRTKEIDTHYTKDYYDDLGGIRYTSYDFDKENQNISIVGETKRIDTKNFTLIADLIDKLNASEFFENGEMKSFTKAGDLEEGYTANLKLTLDLQEGFSNSDESKVISEEPKVLNN